MEIKNREEWLEFRKKGIGASEASSILGLNPYKSNVQLWKEKTGRAEPEDISDKPCVAYGVSAEPLLRALFALDYPEYDVLYGGEFDVVVHPNYPKLFCTLDGRLIEKSSGKPGVYEGKTTQVYRESQMEKWTGKVPDYYYCQLLHQLLVTGFDYAVLNGQIKRDLGNKDVRCETRRYFIERKDVQADIDHLFQEELKFLEYVEKDIEPPLK